VLIGAWRTDAAMRAHFSSGAYGSYVEAVTDLLTRPSDVVIHSVSGTVPPAPRPVARAREGELMATTVLRSEQLPGPRRRGAVPAADRRKIEWLAKRGERRTFQPGEVLYEHAVRDAPFYVIDQRPVEFVDRKPGKDVYIAEADSRTFIGDIAIFTGEPTISACVAVEPTDVIVFDRAALRDMVARWPEFGEHVFRTLLARRAWHEAEGTASCA
jgi:hypothetical protein